MSTDDSRPMTPEQEYEFYADARNLEPQGRTLRSQVECITDDYARTCR